MSKAFLENIEHIVVPSNFAKEKTKELSGHTGENIIVIPNAIDPLKYDPDKFKKVKKPKLIYISGSMRGLEILLRAVPEVEGDFELEILSDMNPHVSDFLQQIKPLAWVNRTLSEHENVMMYGRSPIPTVRRKLQESHIFAYPNTYQETFCLSLVEGLSAGLMAVAPNTDAIHEIAGNYLSDFAWEGVLSDFVKDGYGPQLTEFSFQYEDNYKKNVTRYAEALSLAISKIQNNDFDPSEQVDHINKTYNWDAIGKQWLDFHAGLD
jgi:glycosyltransferase involved in cell wall biosynthesis